MLDYDKLIEKAPIIGIGKKIVHLGDFVNDVRFNTDKQFNKEQALEDLDVLFDFINKYLKIEQELGINLTTLFDKKYEGNCLLCVEEDKSIYFCGDAYYGHYSKEGFLDLIKELISVYRELIKVETKRRK